MRRIFSSVGHRRKSVSGPFTFKLTSHKNLCFLTITLWINYMTDYIDYLRMSFSAELRNERFFECESWIDSI